MIYITHIRMSPPSSNLHEHIASLKWRNPSSGDTGQSSRETMVEWIDDGGAAYVQATPDVRVVVVDAQPKYVRTVANNTYTDNLLSLPRF